MTRRGRPEVPEVIVGGGGGGGGGQVLALPEAVLLEGHEWVFGVLRLPDNVGVGVLARLGVLSPPSSPSSPPRPASSVSAQNWPSFLHAVIHNSQTLGKMRGANLKLNETASILQRRMSNKSGVCAGQQGASRVETGLHFHTSTSGELQYWHTYYIDLHYIIATSLRHLLVESAYCTWNWR